MQSQARLKIESIAWVVLVIGCLCYMATMYLRACPAILALDLQDSFGVDAARVSLFSSAAFIGYGIMQMPAGLFTDAIGARRALALLMLLAAFATIVFAYVPNFELAVGARFVTGLTLAAMPALGAVLALYFPSQRFTQALGILMASGSLGNLLAAEPLARLSIALSWREAMLVSAVVIAFLGIAVATLIRKKSPGAEQGLPASAKAGLILQGMKRIFRSKHYWYLAIWQIASSSFFFAFMSMWAGPYLMNACGLEKITASRILLLQGLAAIFVVPLLAALVDRINSRRGGLIICSCFGLAGTLSLVLFAGSLPFVLLVLSIMGLTVCGTAGATCVFSLIRHNFPPELTGTGIGCANMFWPFCAAISNGLIGFLLYHFMGPAPEALTQALVAAAYGKAFAGYILLYICALVLAVFFIKEQFSIAND